MRRLLPALAIVALLVVAAVAAGTVAQTGPGEETNESIQHENPATAEGSGDLGAIRQRLLADLSESLDNGSVALSEGQYEQAQAALGEDFQQDLDRYAEVANATGSEEDQRTVRELRQLQQNQSSYTNATAEYERTYDRYQAALEAGNTSEARRYARELERLADRISTTGSNLDQGYDIVGNLTGRPTGDAERRVRNVTTNVTSRQTTVREEVFVRTDLTVSAAEGTTASFADPLTVEGRLVATNGTALANRTVAVEIGAQSTTVTTDTEGRFDLQYRPVQAPTGAQSVVVRYRPEGASVYLSSNATVNASVDATTPALALTNVTTEARFGEEVRVTGRVQVDGQNVSRAPVVVSLAGEPVAVAETGLNGTFDLELALPAAVATGEQPLSVAAGAEGRAISRTTTERTVSVAPTQSDVAIDAQRLDNGSVRVTGALTAGDRAVPNGTVVTRIDGAVAESVRTGPDGSFAMVVPAEETESVALSVRFDGEGTNLNGSMANASLAAVDSGGGGGADAGLPVEPWQGGLVALLLAVGAGVVVWTRYAGADGAPTDVDAPAPTPSSAPTDAETESGVDAAAVVGRAAAEAGDDPAAAVALAYAAVRATVGSETPGATHWEFLAATRAGLDDGRGERLASLTTAYERATFAPEPVSQTTAEDAVADARAVTDGADGATTTAENSDASVGEGDASDDVSDASEADPDGSGGDQA